MITYEELKNKLPEWPAALQQQTWQKFGNALGRDVSLNASMQGNPNLRQQVKQAGGISAIWKEKYPEGAKWAIQKYGWPSQSAQSTQPMQQFQYPYPMQGYQYAH